MTEQIIYGLLALLFWVLGMIYAHGANLKGTPCRYKALVLVSVLITVVMEIFLAPNNIFLSVLVARTVFLTLLSLVIRVVWQKEIAVACYLTIWTIISWQLLYEIWYLLGYNGSYQEKFLYGVLAIIVIYGIGAVVVAKGIANQLLAEGRTNIGPRQLISAFLLFLIFEMAAFISQYTYTSYNKTDWQLLFMTQILIAIILYLQNELFKKSVIRHQLAIMELLWKKEQEQYQLAKENIALINHKCHDLKHQIRALRNANKEEIDKYLEEIEGSIRIYEAIVKTGNEVLDTILTEKSLYCKDRGIQISCVADGAQMKFIDTIDLYTILGNALDNAIEAVEKFKHKEKRQIDVMIHRQQNFLVINIVNPMKDTLVYEEELPVTTKGDKSYHGFGLKSIDYIVKKYDGFLTVKEEDGCFSLKILMPIPG